MTSWFRLSKLDTSKLPPGDLGASLVGNTFTFHQDAQSLILSNLAKYPGTPIIRAKVIGRDVALVVDHAVASSILDQSSAVNGGVDEAGEQVKGTPRARFSHREAYKQLIATFFSEPNILLEDEDEPNRAQHRSEWDQHMSNVLGSGWAEIQTKLRSLIERYKEGWVDGPSIDIYKGCKDLSHDIIFGLFLGIDRTSNPQLFDRVLEVSDTSSRGQFSIPLRANLGGMFESTYSKGLRAQTEFNDIVSSQISSSQCPFINITPSRSGSNIPKQSLDSHTAMFSSSLVIKALSSYLTFAILQLSHLPEASVNLNSPITQPNDNMNSNSEPNLDHILLETERLCPPIIGVLRRILDVPWSPTLTPDTDPARETSSEIDMEIPVGWDTWLYFPLINRGPKIYGPDANLFRPERWAENPHLVEPMTFGKGAKSCLGRDLIRRIGKLVLQVLCEDTGATGKGRVIVKTEGLVDRSIQDFMGWVDDPEIRKGGWPGVKQLPTQRPREKVIVRFER